MRFLIYSFLLMVSLLSGVVAKAEQSYPVREVAPCEDIGVGLGSLMHPLSANTRSFYNEQVWLYKVDTIEPACCPYGIAVVLPDVESPLGDSKCIAVMGLSGAKLDAAKASYDPSKGLLVQIPTTLYNEGGPEKIGPPLKLRINLNDSTVVLE